jgi:predicted methyltransferase
MTQPESFTRRRVLRDALALTAVAGLGAGCATEASPPDAGLRAAIDGPQRSPANRARDGARHPYETLRFFGLAPTQTVVEISPGGGWYTEILAPYLRADGKLYAAHYPADDADEGRRKSRAAFEARLKQRPEVYGRVAVGSLPDATHAAIGLPPPGSADRVLTFRNVHNWIEAGTVDATFASFHALLKPGGVLGVEEHRAPAGKPLDWIVKNGYVPEQLVIERATTAGFRLAGRSEVNANPRDTRDHEGGVWSLPPTLQRGAVERERYVAIGESDRMTLRFVKG